MMFCNISTEFTDFLLRWVLKVQIYYITIYKVYIWYIAPSNYLYLAIIVFSVNYIRNKYYLSILNIRHHSLSNYTSNLKCK